MAYNERFCSSFVIRDSSFRRQATHGFTLMELLIVIAVIATLAALVLSTAGYVQKKGARSRAEAEIAAISAALESYKVDNGAYPRDPTPGTYTDALNPRTMGDPVSGNALAYMKASLVLYRALSGDRNLDRIVNTADQNFDIDGSSLAVPLTELPKPYFSFKPSMLGPADQAQNVQYVRDPFGNPYGYSTAFQNNATTGYNPTFDMWSTAGLTTNPAKPDTITPQWVKNW